MRYIESYVHKSKVGVLIEIETDGELTTSRDEFRQLARDLVLQVAAGKPASPDELLSQPFIKEAEQAVSHRIYVVSTQLNAPIRITRFVRYDADET
jgi:translation elongation factor EF-Ts